MRFRMRHADQLVGFLVAFALLALIFTIFVLGRSQAWFSRTHSYVTYASTAAGLSRNMPINFRGIPIGNVRSFRLTDNNDIEIIFTINNDYNNRVRHGSLVEISISPIGIGNQVIFHSGLGEQLEEGARIHNRHSPEGIAYIARGLVHIPPNDDLITLLASRAEGILDEVQIILQGISLTLEGLNVAPNEAAVTALGQTIANIQTVTAVIAEDISEADIFSALEATLVALSGNLDNLERTTAQLPGQMPQLMALITDLRSAIQSADAVLIGLSNNPLLRRGIPDRVEIDSSGHNPRSIRF